MTASFEVGHAFAVHGPLEPDAELLRRWTAAHAAAVEASATAAEGAATVPGSWKAAMLRALLPQWLERTPGLASFGVRHHAVDQPGEPLTFGGSVREVQVDEAGRRAVTCDLWCRAAGGALTTTARVTALLDDPAPAQLPLDALRNALRVGEDVAAFTYRVESNDVLRLNDALGVGRDDDTVPTTYFALLDPVERRDLDLDGFLEELALPRTGGGNAFNEVIYERPLQVGDVLTVTTRYTDVYEKPGSRGTLLFRVRINEMRDDRGRLVATSRCGHVLGFRVASGQGAAS